MSLFVEDDLLPLSALQHLVFCERQCALIHIEKVWADNALTVEGSHRHERVHEQAPRREVRGDVVITRGLPLRSFELGVSGIADVVEFHRMATPGQGQSPAALVALQGLPGRWRPFPVEYKRGKPKANHCDAVQLCAQAICVEEMLKVPVPQGALFYGATQRRHDVSFDEALRHETKEVSGRLHGLMRDRVTPRVERRPACRRCSLVDQCRPDATAPGRSASLYVRRAFQRIVQEEVTSP